MSRRLERARTLLRRRLTHRGLTLAIIGLAAAARPSDWARAGPRGRSACNGSWPHSSPWPKAARDSVTSWPPPRRARDSRPDFARILPAAREAATAARRLEDHDAGRMAPLWNHYARDMKRSAVELERACEQSDSLGLVAAARRLSASCLNCHAVFRRGATRPDPPTDPASFRSSSRESTNRSASLHRAATVREPVRLRLPDARSLTLAAPIGTRACGVERMGWRDRNGITPARTRRASTSGFPARRAGFVGLESPTCFVTGTPA